MHTLLNHLQRLCVPFRHTLRYTPHILQLRLLFCFLHSVGMLFLYGSCSAPSPPAVMWLLNWSMISSDLCHSHWTYTGVTLQIWKMYAYALSLITEYIISNFLCLFPSLLNGIIGEIFVARTPSHHGRRPMGALEKMHNYKHKWPSLIYARQ